MGRWTYSFGDARGPRACPPLMPQGLDVTLWSIRLAFGLVKPQTQDIWPEHAFTPYMLVEYLWISLVTSWAQAGQGLGKGAQIASLLDRVDQGQTERFCGNLAFRTGGICGHGFPGRFGDLHSLRRGSNLGRSLLALAVGVLEHGQRALNFVLEDSLEDVHLALDVDEAGLQLLHVDAAGELQVELIEGEEIRQRHRVADDHHVPAVGVDDGAATHVVGRVRDHRQRKRSGRRRVDVLADLAHAPFDLAFDLAHELRAAVRVEPRRRQLLERHAGDPLGVHRQELAAGQAQGQLDHLAADPDVALEHLGWEVSQSFLEDVLAGGAAARAAGDDAFQALQARPGLLLDWLPGRDGGAQTLDHRLGLRQALAKLGRLRFLRLAACLEAGLELGDVPGVPVGATRKIPNEEPDHPDSDHEAYQEQREQQFEHRHIANCSPESGYKQPR